MENYTELKNTTPEQRIQAAIAYYGQSTNNKQFVDGLKHALLLIKEDGWMQIAPAWLRMVGMYETDHCVCKSKE